MRYQLPVNATIEHSENAADEHQCGGAENDNHAVKPDIFSH
jgi:hypothetical protein